MPAHVVSFVEPSQPSPSKPTQNKLPQAKPTPPVLRPRAKINTSAQSRVKPRVPPARVPPPSARVPPPPLARVPPPLARVPPPPPPRYAQIDSPPTSSLSFSSRSSVSATRSDDDHLRPSLTIHTDPPRSPDHKANAKSNRKIADLEITNRSLLAINASLESTKHKQAKEIRDLRRKLRESRLILPPPAFRAVSDDDDPPSSDESDDDQLSQDDAYVRVKSLLDNLLQSARTALQTQPRDFVQSTGGGAKVLSADEVRSWNEEDDPFRTPVPAIHIDSEDEVERTLVHFTPSPPPIHI